MKIKTSESLGGKYLSFSLGNEQYGLSVLAVQEIMQFIDITAMPNVPEYIRGVINLRGHVIPIIELRAIFGMTKIEEGERTCIIVVQVQTQEQMVTLGLVVDQVNDVQNVQDNEVEPPPTFGHSINTSYIKGIRTINNQVTLLLDIDNILNESDLIAIQAKNI